MNDKLIPISRWAEDDKPREKLLNLGKSNLSNAELIAILFRSGSRSDTAVGLSQRILNEHQNNLIQLSKLRVADLLKYNGVGEAKAISLIAALELGKRRRSEEVLQKVKIGSSKDAFEYMQIHLADKSYEEFYVLLLRRSNTIIKAIRVSQGGFSGTVADPKVIFKNALEFGASAIILFHNHPSGNIQASEADVKLTKKLVEAGKLLDLPVLDHIIIGDEKYFSFADESLL